MDYEDSCGMNSRVRRLFIKMRILQVSKKLDKLNMFGTKAVSTNQIEFYQRELERLEKDLDREYETHNRSSADNS